MELISNQLIGYIALFAGVVIGWFLRGLWKSVRERRNRKPVVAEFVGGEDIKADVESVIKEEKEADKRRRFDAEYSDGKFRIVEK